MAAVTSSGQQLPAIGSCKRRLAWPETWGSQELDDDAAQGCGATKGAACQQADGRSELEAESPPAGTQPYVLAQSPIINHTLFLNGKRKARVLFSPPRVSGSSGAGADAEQQQPQLAAACNDDAQPAAAEPAALPLQQPPQLRDARLQLLLHRDEEEQHLPSPAPQQLRPSAEPQQQQQPQLQQQLTAANGVACQRQLSAAVSSTTGSLDVLFRSIVAEQLATAAAATATAAAAARSNSPCTPADAAPLARLPAAAPAARQLFVNQQRRAVNAATIGAPRAVARSLPGLAPSCEAELLHLRSWLSGLEARC